MKEIKKYYPNGQIWQHYWVDENNRIDGEYKSWYENGQIYEHRFFKNGSREGEHKNWYENGQLSYHCFFKNGLREGEYKFWHGDGQIWAHLFYHNNKQIDITDYVADVNNITEEEYFHLQLVFGYFPIIKFDEKTE